MNQQAGVNWINIYTYIYSIVQRRKQNNTENTENTDALMKLMSKQRKEELPKWHTVCICEAQEVITP